MSSGKWKSGLAAIALISTTLVALAQEAPDRMEIGGLAAAPAAALPRSEYACPHIAQVCLLLADPAVRNFVGLADYTWDFTAPIGVLDIAPLPIQAERTNSFTQECAHRDTQLVTLIEDHGNAGDVAPEKLLEANFAMMRARTTCAEGRESEAIALYDDIALGLMPTRASR
jgi:hypothetical protein